MFGEETTAIPKVGCKDVAKLFLFDFSAGILVLRYKLLFDVVPDLSTTQSLEPADKMARTHLHSADPSAKCPTGCSIALLPLALLFQRCSVTAILPCPHLEVENAWVLESAREIFHEDKVLLPGNVVVEGRAVVVFVFRRRGVTSIRSGMRVGYRVAT
jgi:hypothetical protein